MGVSQIHFHLWEVPIQQQQIILVIVDITAAPVLYIVGQ